MWLSCATELPSAAIQVWLLRAERLMVGCQLVAGKNKHAVMDATAAVAAANLLERTCLKLSINTTINEPTVSAKRLDKAISRGAMAIIMNAAAMPHRVDEKCLRPLVIVRKNTATSVVGIAKHSTVINGRYSGFSSANNGELAFAKSNIL